MEILAANVVHDRRNNKESPGVSFARTVFMDPAGRSGKDSARGALIGKFGSAHPRPLSILTLPGVAWRFEKKILYHRRRAGLETKITALEKDPAIFAASLADMPGNSRGYEYVDQHESSAAAVSTYKIHRYYCAAFEDFARTNEETFDAAWIDLTGPVGEKVLLGLARLWPYVREALVVTSLKARWNRVTSARVRHLGGVANLLKTTLQGSAVECDHEYCDSSPMSQVTLTPAGRAGLA